MYISGTEAHLTGNEPELIEAPSNPLSLEVVRVLLPQVLAPLEARWKARQLELSGLVELFEVSAGVPVVEINDAELSDLNDKLVPLINMRASLERHDAGERITYKDNPAP